LDEIGFIGKGGRGGGGCGIEMGIVFSGGPNVLKSVFVDRHSVVADY